jgi:hypothetical protein
MNDDNNDPLANALGLTPFRPQDVVEVAPAVVETDQQEYAKTQIRSAIEDGRQALGDLLNIAQSSQHPRAFEVVAKLIDTVTNASEKLAGLEIKQQEFVKKSQQPSQSGPGTVNNNLFVGNATELLRMIKETQKK